MRCISRIFRLTLICIAAASCCLYGNDKSNKNKKYETISSSMKLSIDTASQPNAKTSGSGGSKNMWVNVDLRFRTDNIKNMRSRFLDNPELYVQLAANVTIKTANKKELEKCMVFSGTVKYFTIEQDGENHYMKVLLPGAIYRRFAYGVPMDKAVFHAKAELRCNGKSIGSAYASSKSMQEKDLIKFFRKFPANHLNIPGSLCGRAGTTWSIIDVNKFELEKNPSLSVDISLKSETDKTEPEDDEVDVTPKKKKSKKK